MCAIMADDSSEIGGRLARAGAGDDRAVGDLVARYRDRLKRMVRLRLSRHLQGRVDDSDVLQDALLEASRRLGEYLQSPDAPFFLWLRQITSHKIVDAHRRHLGAQARDAELEISLHR